MSRPSTNGSNKYRTVSKGSFVDESLFGGGRPGQVGKGKPQNVEVITKDQVQRDQAARVPAAVDPTQADLFNPCVVSLRRCDLERMHLPSPIMSADQIAAQKRAAEAKREQERAASKARKEKMLKMEEEARKAAPPSEMDLLKQQTDLATLSKAKSMLEEEKDDVKHMNQMILYAKCVTIRDAQILEKKNVMQEEQKERQYQDTMMEQERLKALAQYEERERRKLEEQRRGAQILQEQISEREKERIRQEELRDQERIQIMKEIERLKEAETQINIERKMQAQALMAEVAAANQEQIRRKESMKVREQEEEAQIAEYLRQKELREQALAAEKERIAKEKELEVARLRALQEKAADKQAELDELRARRYQEAKDREWRAKERAMAERQTAMQRELAEARAAQQNAKLKQLSDMATLEREEFLRVIDVNRQKEMEDMAQAAASHTINHKYREQLQVQIQANEEKKRKEKQEYLQEGDKLRKEMESEKTRLVTIKERKLKQLQDDGVPAKYRAELARKKVLV